MVHNKFTVLEYLSAADKILKEEIHSSNSRGLEVFFLTLFFTFTLYKKVRSESQKLEPFNKTEANKIVGNYPLERSRSRFD